MRAMILAAGLGQRLRPLTDNCPKPLLKVEGRPLIDYLLENLRNSGVIEVVINISYLADKFQEALKDGSKWGLKIHYSYEEKPLESGGGIYNALEFLGTSPFILVNGDIWTDFCFRSLPKNIQNLGHLVLVPNPKHHPKGDFALNGESVQALDSNKKPYTYSGIAVINPKLFANCKKGTFPLAPLFSQAISKQMLSGELYKGNWINVNDLECLQSLEGSFPPCHA